MTMLLYLTLCIVLCVTPPWAYAQRPQTTFDANAPTARGLIGWWRALPGFTGGTVLYDVMGRDHMTLSNTTTNTGTDRQGGRGHVVMNGSNSYGSTVVSSRFFPATQTLMAWVKRTAAGGSFQLVIGASNNLDRQLYIRTSGNLAYQVNFTTGNFGGDFTGPTLAVGTWYHVAMLISATGGFISYVNCNVQQAFGADGSTFNPVTYGVIIGAEAGGTVAQLTGLIDDVRIYNRAVPQTELCQIVRDAQMGEPSLLPQSSNVKPTQPLGFVAIVTAFIKSRFLYFFPKQ